MTITPELQEAIRSITIQQMEQHYQDQKRSLNMYQRICKELEPELACCKYDRADPVIRQDGTLTTRPSPRDMRNKVRGAIGTLLITAYHADRVARLPVDKEEDIREFVRDVLALVSAHQQKNALSGASNT